MKRIALIAAVMVMAAMPFRVFAEEYATAWAISPDGKVGVAVHAYSTGADQKRLEVKIDGKKQPFYPVGLLIQNYGDEELNFYFRWIGMKADGAKRERPSVCPIHPYRNGTALNKGLNEDAARFNGVLKFRRPNDAYVTNERVNDVFYLSTLGPKSSYFGVSYLEVKGEGGDRKKPKSLDGAYFYAGIMNKNYSGGYVARLPLGGDENGAFVDDEGLTKKFKAYVGGLYVGSVKEKPADGLIYNDYKTLAVCRNKAQAAVSKDTKVSSRKEYVWADAIYDRYGDVVSCDIRSQSSDKRVNELMQKLTESLKHCEGLSSSNLNSEGKGRGVPFYRIEIGIGDQNYKKKEKKSEEQGL